MENQKGINVLSLFDGKSGAQIALERAKIKVNNYFACEIDQPCIIVAMANYPNTIQLGDVTKIKAVDLPKIDLVIGGSPCQGFSFSGKQLNFKDPRSALFFEFVRIWKEVHAINPDAKFLLENVNMKKEYMGVINRALEILPANINSNRVSAQNRNRWYWTNIKTKKVGFFGEVYSDIPQPEDKGILLRDILEDDVPSKYFLSAKAIKGLATHAHNRRQNWTLNGSNDKAKAITVSHANRNLDSNYVCVAMRGRNPENPSDRRTGSPTQQRLEAKTDGKTNCLTSVAKDNLIMSTNYIQWDVSGKGHKSQQDRAFFENTKHGALASSRAETKTGVLTNDHKLRRLTPIECERLQTIPDNYTNHVSDTQRYKMLGNGFTIDVIAHILKQWKL